MPYTTSQVLGNMKFYKVFRKDETDKRSLLRVGDIRVTDNGGIFFNFHMFNSEDYVILPDREMRQKYIIFSVKEYEVQGERKKKWSAIGELSIESNGDKVLHLNALPATYIVLSDLQDKSEDILLSGDLHPLR